MATFYFVRHGETDENKAHHIQGRRNIELNDNGRTQARLAGKYMKKNNYEFDYIYSSPLDRAYETACIISKIIGFNGDVIKNDEFTERCFGVCEGLPVCDEVFVDILNDTAEGLEKSFDIQKRVSDEVKRLSKSNEDINILVVAHSHTIKALMTYIDDKLYRFDQRLDNCSISIFDVNNGIITLRKNNICTQ